MRIGELARQTGVSVRSLRYYEQQHLLVAARSAGDQRMFGTEHVERVRLLRRLFDAGLSSATIAALLPCVDAPSDAATLDALTTMRHERDRIAEQIAELVTTREQLSYLIDAAAGFHDEHGDRCAGADVPAVTV